MSDFHEQGRPGITTIIERLRKENPKWPEGYLIHRAKQEWHKSVDRPVN